MRACSLCGAVGFPHYISTPSRCKECVKKAARDNRAKNLDRVRLYDRCRAALPHRMEKNARTVREWRGQHPDRFKAQSAVNNAIRNGRLTRQVCWVCGERAVAHHPDYSRPLDVVWLCQAHHKQTHALIKDAA